MQKIYVTYFLEYGSILPEESVEEMEYPVNKFDIPDRCYGFRLWFRNEEEVDGEIMKGEPYGHLTAYYGGRLYSLEQVKNGEYSGSTSILVDNMEGNGWSHVIHTRYGRCLHFDIDKHVFISEGESYAP